MLQWLLKKFFSFQEFQVSPYKGLITDPLINPLSIIFYDYYLHERCLQEKWNAETMRIWGFIYG